MTQKVNSKQLKEIYFNPPSSVRTFHESSRYNKMRKSNHSFLESEKHYQKYSEEEISKFEDFFNKHYYHPNSEANIPISNKQENMNFLDVFEPIVTDKHLEKGFDSNFELNTNTFISHDEAHAPLDNVAVPNVDCEEVSQISLLEQDLLKQSAANIETFTEDFNLGEPVSLTTDELLVDDGNNIVDINQEEKVVEHAIADYTDADVEVDEEIVKSINDEEIDIALDDDLIYLENLVSNGGNGVATTPLSSIGNLLNEIVDNEKNQISNYETNVFNANIQSLFDADPEDDLPSVPQPPIVPQFIATPIIPSMMSVASNNEGVDDEAIETEIQSSDDMKHIESNDNPVCEVLKVDSGLLNTNIEPCNDSKQLDEKEIDDDFIDFIPKKQLRSKKSKFNIIDTILVILLFILVGILVYQFRYVLPFDLPFMNRI